MQDSTEAAPVRAGEDELESAAERAQAALLGGRLAAARGAAEGALKQCGPSPALYAVLGRAHAAEDEDDHDDRAETVYRSGLAAFPDDPDLLAGYAELCLRSDPFDRPARHGRGPGLVERLREVAPGSPQALRLEQAAADRGRPSSGTGIRPPSPSRVQRHDVRETVRTTSNLAAAARGAQEQSGREPYDLRLAVRAETLAVLARPGRGLLVRILMAPLLSLPLGAVLVSAIVLARPAFHLPAWVPLLGLVVCLPYVVLSLMLRGARKRAELRGPATAPIADRTKEMDAAPAGAAENAPGSDGGPQHRPNVQVSPCPPPPDAAPRRHRVVALTSAAVVVASVTGSLLWSNAQYRSYPRYTTSAPASFRGAPLLTGHPVQALLESTMATEWSTGDGRTFSYAYGRSPQALVPATLVFGATGDFHEASADVARFFEEGLRFAGNTPTHAWTADAGRLGGWLRCVTYAGPLGDASTACSWADKGGLATVVLNETGLSHEAAASSTRSLLATLLHRTDRRQAPTAS
ncbi:hypothetical protein E6R60_09050 [Streptomyces sp. A0642]|uniref:hypothetical protein n=1 Tax=Streptomyces sp. A0642 TaxID=2563100 RepID=UPI0010A29459|nr:hypothetical protein [Streptomyces sp. A0642]THA77670.1 hypothetical protein E6R60_09050 [Streptomyces sp. A0642]